MTPERIYLDHNARAPLRPQARQAMSAAMELRGNPSSIHWEGQQAKALLEESRGNVAAMIGAAPRDLVVTSGATESLHALLHGALLASPRRKGLLTSATEHHAVLEEMEALHRREGRPLTVVDVDAMGRPDLDAWRAALDSGDVAAAVIMAANNETGVMPDVTAFCTRARAAGTFVIVDAAQVMGKVPVQASSWGADAVAFSSAKFGGPPGIGGFWLSPEVGKRWISPRHGGSQETGRRPGTEDLIGLAGMGAAASAALLEEGSRIRALRDRFEAGLRTLKPQPIIHGQEATRLPNTTFAAFPGVDGPLLLMLLDQAGVAASGGSACTSGAVTISHVLRAMKVDPALAQGSIRFSLGHATADPDVERALELLASILPRARL